jgi:hypothetical protein
MVDIGIGKVSSGVLGSESWLAKAHQGLEIHILTRWIIFPHPDNNHVSPLKLESSHVTFAALFLVADKPYQTT